MEADLRRQRSSGRTFSVLSLGYVVKGSPEASRIGVSVSHGGG